MRYIKLYEDFRLGDFEEIQKLFFKECRKEIPNSVLIKVILDNGLADVNAKDDLGEFPLHWAVRWNNITFAKLLISAGADVNAKDDFGHSPLHVAVSMGLKEMQALLKKHGAVE